MRHISLLFKALSDNTRLRILWMLKTRPLCVCEIREVLQLAVSTVSKHLSILRDAGFIVDYKDGKWVNYARNPDPNAEQVQALLTLVDQWMEREKSAQHDQKSAASVNRNIICNSPLKNGDSMKILILCTGNSCRSQMAEGWLKSFDDRLEVFSAGTAPAERVHPKAVQVMAEVGIDLSANFPKSVAQFLPISFDYVITVCDHAQETCPVFFGSVKQHLHIGFEDPASVVGNEEHVLNEFRRIRDEIKEGFYKFYKSLEL